MATIDWTKFSPDPYNKSVFSADRAVVRKGGRVDFDFIIPQFDPASDDFTKAENPAQLWVAIRDAAAGIAKHVEGANPVGMSPEGIGQSGRQRVYDLANDALNLVTQAQQSSVVQEGFGGAREVPMTEAMRISLTKQAVRALWRAYVLLAAYAVESKRGGHGPNGDLDYMPPFSATVQRNFAGFTQFGGASSSAPPKPETPAPSPFPGFGFGQIPVPPEVYPTLPGLGEEAPPVDDTPDDTTDDDPEGTAPASSSSLPLIVGGAAALLLLVAMSRKGR